MRFPLRFKYVGHVVYPEADGFFTLHENIQIPVHVSKAERGKIRLQPVEHRHCTQVRSFTAKQFQNSIPLFTLPILNTHR